MRSFVANMELLVLVPETSDAVADHARAQEELKRWLNAKKISFLSISSSRTAATPWQFDVGLSPLQGMAQLDKQRYIELDEDVYPQIGDEFNMDPSLSDTWVPVRANHNNKTVKQFRVGQFERIVFRRPTQK